MLKWLARKWAINDPLPPRVDLIAVISYAATSARLTRGSSAVLRLARDLADQHKEASIRWGWFSKNPNLREKEVKSIVLGSGCVGPVSSSTDECQAIRSAVETDMPRTIVVISEGAHSRRCKRVWEYFFPDSEVCFRSIPAWEAGDKENPMWFQREWQVWLMVNIAADLLAYRWRPVLRFLIKKNFSQPAAS